MRDVHADGGVWLLCQVYRNPYNYGRLNNWKVFLGVEKRRCASGFCCSFCFVPVYAQLIWLVFCLQPLVDPRSPSLWTHPTR